MKSFRYHQAAFALALVLSGVQSATAANFSFTGNFTHDNDVQLFDFSIAVDTSVFVRTYSFGGGTNAAGTPIAPGGFTPYFNLFKADGTWIAAAQSPSACGVGGNPANADPGTGVCWDTFLDLPSLLAGSYLLALTQYDNIAVGSTLAEGFAYDGGPADFTGGPFFEAALPPFGVQRDSHWAVDILFVDQASPAGVPEPGTLPLAMAGLAGFATFARRRSAPLSPQN
jgi:hypothetical protein